jgi:hypothetical protein
MESMIEDQWFMLLTLLLKERKKERKKERERERGGRNKERKHLRKVYFTSLFITEGN